VRVQRPGGAGPSLIELTTYMGVVLWKGVFVLIFLPRLPNSGRENMFKEMDNFHVHVLRNPSLKQSS
jgi:hypothetical protein